MNYMCSGNTQFSSCPTVVSLRVTLLVIYIYGKIQTIFSSIRSLYKCLMLHSYINESSLHAWNGLPKCLSAFGMSNFIHLSIVYMKNEASNFSETNKVCKHRFIIYIMYMKNKEIIVHTQ